MTPITPEQRRKVAEVCGHRIPKGMINIHLWWEPSNYEGQWQALVQKIAQLIEDEKKNATRVDEYEFAEQDSERFVYALSTNDIPALEALLLELIP